MDDEAVRVRALPAGRGVGGVARVDERHGGLHGGVVQVGEEAAHLRGHEHALVHDGARAHGADIEDLALERVLGVGALLDHAAAYVQAALERVAALDVVGAAEERLLDGGHARPRRLAQVVRVDRHVAPEQHGDPLLRAALLEGPFGRPHAMLVLRQEEHGHAVVALGGQQLAAALGLLAEESVGDLEQDARSVSRVALEARAASVLEVDEHRERVVEYLVASRAVDGRERADAAGVVLELRPVEGLMVHISSHAMSKTGGDCTPGARARRGCGDLW